jgi:hypothetical protein
LRSSLSPPGYIAGRITHFIEEERRAAWEKLKVEYRKRAAEEQEIAREQYRTELNFTLLNEAFHDRNILL